MVTYGITVAGDRAASLEASRTKSSSFQTLKGVSRNLGAVTRLYLAAFAGRQIISGEVLGQIQIALQPRSPKP
ncbi:hypothetical protein EAE99_001960 [Botrytis elliptica]|nr:hypothetical protein EAE99_001960 [Botrytis elliptica]